MGVIALHDADHTARDAAFNEMGRIEYVRVRITITKPICPQGHGPMRRTGEYGRTRYYQCQKCGQRAQGTTIRENL